MSAAHSSEFEDLVDSMRPRVTEITLEETKRRLAENPKAILVDVREDGEWEKGRARGAVHMGRGVIERDIVARVPEKNTELILYCGGGYRSVLAAVNLQAMGYSRVRSLIGGFRNMQAGGFPMEGGGGCGCP
ncbi:MAG: sulfurtransferase [Verrucomicrobiae bacterium]|nr:sulfurtransferase [Verrucomicrobiae bacterium]